MDSFRHSIRQGLWIFSLLLLLVGFLPQQAEARLSDHLKTADFSVLSDETIRDEIQEEVRRGHRPLGYGRARQELLGRMTLIQTSQGYAIHDVYCDADYTAEQFPKGNGPGPGIVPAATVLNTEHTWPQSKFGGKEKDSQKCDLHHLFPSDSQMNSTRSSHPFGEVVADRQNVKCSASRFGKDSSGRWAFEPPNKHKGDVARALFYFSLRYNLSIDEAQEATLRKWNALDPVSPEELSRNDEVEKIQGNRNPFIDRPDLSQHLRNF